MAFFTSNIGATQALNTRNSVAGGLAGGIGYGASSGGAFKEGFAGGSSHGFSFSSSAGFEGAESSIFGNFAGDEKQTMHNLNDRLAAYLEKVRALEAANTELEIKIREWYDREVGVGVGAESKDYSKYYDAISVLKSKFLAASITNSQIVLEIENARLAVDDFRLKYESEQLFRQTVESDINELRQALEELVASRGDFEIQIESLTEELAYMRKSHEEAAQVARNSAAGKVNVEMDAAPGVDLIRILNDMRGDYEALSERNRKNAEVLFAQKSNELKNEIAASGELVQTSKSEITDIRRNLQSVEVELQSLLTMQKSLEDALADTESRYGTQLQQLQLIICGKEEQLLQIRSDMERQSLEYRELLDIKTRLELEIETYRCLLEGELDQSSSQSVSSFSPLTKSTSEVISLSSTISASSSVETVKDPTKTITVKTIFEEVVDGKVVSSRVEKIEQTLI